MNTEQLKSVPKERLIETVRLQLVRLIANETSHIHYLQAMVAKSLSEGMATIESRYPCKGIQRNTLLDLWIAASNIMPIVNEGKQSKERHAEVVEVYEMCADLSEYDPDLLYNACYHYAARVLSSN